MKEILDREVVARLHTGDVEAFTALYWKYHKAVYLNILKLVKEPDTSQDILQEVFLALWEKRADFKPDQSVAGWLFVVSYNKSVNHVKKKLQVHLPDSELVQTPDESDEIAHSVKETRFLLLEQAMMQLSPQKKKVFELCKLEGKTYDETAAELDISRHTVKEYLSAALFSIKEYIRKQNGEIPLLLLLFLLHP